MDYIAHTPRKDNQDPVPHIYAEHVREVLVYGISLFEYLLTFCQIAGSEKNKLRETFKAALMLHDMGKLDEENQRVFRGEVLGSLPVDHIEAGVAVADEMKNELLGWLIRGHHAPGLPSKKTEKYFIRELRNEFDFGLTNFCLRGGRHGRDKHFDDARKEHAEAILTTNQRLELYKQTQRDICGEWPVLGMSLPSSGLLIRLMLSCLVDADHSSAASYTTGTTIKQHQPLDGRWQERLDALDQYVYGLSQTPCDSGRSKMRSEFYQSCRNSDLHASSLSCCSAPVGLGKTTSVMAYILRRAIAHGLSRIFIIAPFSNIIDQTVRVLRKAIVLDGEDAEKTVVAHHHKADFSNDDMRHYAASWDAPIVVTTSVQFFETLAGANPVQLRKLHNIVGSAIFIDESDACLPAGLLDISWHWIKQLSDYWNCHFVFSSGSMVKFWEDRYLVSENHTSLHDILPQSLDLSTRKSEKQRISMQKLQKPVKRDELLEIIQSNSVWDGYLEQEKPSCLVILNTVQSAAVIAKRLSEQLDGDNQVVQNKQVLHLSTALAPRDRLTMLNEVLRRQKNSEWDNKPWYLVATSCVEAGVDLDFAVGFRESCSVRSFIQISGRINRHGKRNGGVLYDFSIIELDGLVAHPGFVESSDVFRQMWDELVSGELNNSSVCTKAMRKEFSRDTGGKESSMDFLACERSGAFQEVSNQYKLINSSTCTVVIDENIVKKLEGGVPVDWQEIQNCSVQLWVSKIAKLGLREISGCANDSIYSWIDTHEYDPCFLGVMAGLLNTKETFRQAGGVI